MPLANNFLTFILLDLLKSNVQFKRDFNTILKLWKRFIDDCIGIFKGNFQNFNDWFNVIKEHFHKYELELTYDTDSHSITNSEVVEKDFKSVQFLDMELYKEGNCLHTREYRKETSSQSYLRYSSAHPRHTFSGIIKSQMYRMRRLCSRDLDYSKAIDDLKLRCLKSGYPSKIVVDILNKAPNIVRRLTPNTLIERSSKHVLRLVILSGTSYEQQFSSFVARINAVMDQYKIRMELVKTNYMSIGRLLFNNCDQKPLVNNCQRDCLICINELNSKKGSVTSIVTNLSYKVDHKLTCNDAGIYVVKTPCGEQYTGKTTNPFKVRTSKHLLSDDTTVSGHRNRCVHCKDNVNDFDITFVEHYLSRGKYSLSEREMVWNKRVQGSINIQKTLKA